MHTFIVLSDPETISFNLKKNLSLIERYGMYYHIHKIFNRTIAELKCADHLPPMNESVDDTVQMFGFSTEDHYLSCNNKLNWPNLD